MIVNLILLGVFVAVTFAMWRQEGPWGGLIMLLNVLLAAALATAWYGPLARLVAPHVASYTYLVDFVMVQGLFCLILLAMRETTDRLSRNRVRFRKPIELAIGPIVGLLTAWIMVGFTAMTLHMAPVPEKFVPSSADARMFFGLGPDRWWLSWMRNVSKYGPFGSDRCSFDPTADFIDRYAARRKQLEGEKELRVNAP